MFVCIFVSLRLWDVIKASPCGFGHCSLYEQLFARMPAASTALIVLAVNPHFHRKSPNHSYVSVSCHNSCWGRWPRNSRHQGFTATVFHQLSQTVWCGGNRVVNDWWGNCLPSSENPTSISHHPNESYSPRLIHQTQRKQLITDTSHSSSAVQANVQFS